MEIAEAGGYLRKPKVGWYEAVNPETGELLSEKLLRAKEIVDNSAFWDIMFKQTDFEDFITQIIEKREEVYNAFEARKNNLLEARNNRTTALQNAAERILNGIKIGEW